MNTIRLVVPYWQAGNDPIYRLGADVIAPENPNQETLYLLLFRS